MIDNTPYYIFSMPTRFFPVILDFQWSIPGLKGLSSPTEGKHHQEDWAQEKIVVLLADMLFWKIPHKVAFLISFFE
jgi:hypothetical protein